MSKKATKKTTSELPESQAIDKLRGLLDEHIAKPSPGSQRAGETSAVLMSDPGKRAVLKLSKAAQFQERRGDDPLVDAEDMVVSQAQILDDLFHTYASLAQANLSSDRQSSLAIAERLMGLGLRCQKQSLAAIKALNEMKNPKRAVFIKRQQNLLQVEQAQAAQTLKQLGANHDAPLDTGSPREAATTDPEAATLEVEHGA